MLVFQTPHPLGQLAKRFLVSVFSGALVTFKAGLSTAAATPYPSATNDFYLLDYAGITQKFWCNHQMQSVVCQQAGPITFLISQH